MTLHLHGVNMKQLKSSLSHAAKRTFVGANALFHPPSTLSKSSPPFSFRTSSSPVVSLPTRPPVLLSGQFLNNLLISLEHLGNSSILLFFKLS